MVSLGSYQLWYQINATQINACSGGGLPAPMFFALNERHIHTAFLFLYALNSLMVWPLPNLHVANPLSLWYAWVIIYWSLYSIFAALNPVRQPFGVAVPWLQHGNYAFCPTPSGLWSLLSSTSPGMEDHLLLSLLPVLSPGILKVLPLSALPSHWLLPATLFTNQNQLGVGFLCVFHAEVQILSQTIWGGHKLTWYKQHYARQTTEN